MEENFIVELQSPYLSISQKSRCSPADGHGAGSQGQCAVQVIRGCVHPLANHYLEGHFNAYFLVNICCQDMSSEVGEIIAGLRFT